MGLGVLIHFERLEVFELVEAEQAVLPKLGVVDRALVEHQLAADDAVAGDGVALELDARDEELLAFVDVDVHRHGLLLLVGGELGDGAEVDVAEAAVGLFQVVEALADQRGVEPVAVLDGEGGAQRLQVGDLLVAGEGDGAEAVAAALFNGHLNVDALALVGPEGEPVQSALVADLGLGLFDGGVRVALVAVGLAHALRILFELRGVVGLREEVLEDDGIGNADGLEVLHRAAQVERADVPVALELDVAHLHHWAFLDVEVHLDRGRRNGLDLGFDGGELVPMLGQKLLDHGFGVLDLGGIVLAVDGKADFLLLEAVEHVGHRHAVQALVVDVANGGFFADKHVQNDALLGVLALDAQIVEVAGVPERVEIALDGDGVVGVALVGKHAGEDGLFGDAPVANDANLRNGIRRLRQSRTGARVQDGKRQGEQQYDARQPRRGPHRMGDGSVLNLHGVRSLRRAQILFRSIGRLHRKNMHTLIAENLALH